MGTAGNGASLEEESLVMSGMRVPSQKWTAQPEEEDGETLRLQGILVHALEYATETPRPGAEMSDY